MIFLEILASVNQVGFYSDSHNYAACIILSLESQMGIYSLPIMQNLVWHRLIKLCFIWHHTFYHSSDMFKLNKCTKCLNPAIKHFKPTWTKFFQAFQCAPNPTSLQHYCLHFDIAILSFPELLRYARPNSAWQAMNRSPFRSL